jgi:hypothetical protein
MKVLMVIITVFYVAVAQVSGQTIVDGVLTDTEMKPVAYATIAVKGTTSSVMSNENGYFRFPVESFPQHIVISAIGYELTGFVVNTSHISIQLKPMVYQMKEVVVSGDEAYKLFFKAYNKLLKPGYKWFEGKQFYRMVTQCDSVYTELLEGFYNVRATPTGINMWQLKHGRYAIVENYKQKEYPVSIDFSALVRYLDITNDHRSNVLFPAFPFKQYAKKMYQFARAGFTYINNKELSKISFIPQKGGKNMFSGIAYIEERTGKLYRLEVVFEDSLSYFVTTQTGAPVASLDLSYTIDFTEAKSGDMQLNFINLDLNYIKPNHQRSQKVKTRIQCFVFDKGDPQSTLADDAGVVTSYSDYAAIRSRLYVKRFWDENTIITQTADQQTITERFEKSGSFGRAYNEISDTTLLLNDGFKLVTPKVNKFIAGVKEIQPDVVAPGCIGIMQNGKSEASLCSQLFVTHNCYHDSFIISVLPLWDTTSTWMSDSVKQNDSFSPTVNLYARLTLIYVKKLHQSIRQLPDPCNNEAEIYKLTLMYNEELFNEQLKLVKDLWIEGDFPVWNRYIEKLEKEY